MLKLVIIYFFILVFNSVSLFAWPVRILSDDEMHNFYILEANVSHSGMDASIQKVTDGIQIYILKQIHNPSLYEQFLLINDAIASTIGYDAGIHVNKVFFIPDTVATHLKIYPERAATLHVYITGKDLEQELPSYFSENFSIHQRSIDVSSIWQQKWPLNEHQQGLIQPVIESMSLHEDLSSMVALDTFVGNGDRSLPNIFYDKQNNNFYGIDQAAAFNTNLAVLAADRLKELIKDGYFLICDSNIIYALQEYKNVLLRLKSNMSPFKIVQNMEQLLPYLGPNALEDNKVNLRIKDQAKIIEDTYCSILDLILFLGQIQFTNLEAARPSYL